MNKQWKFEIIRIVLVYLLMEQDECIYKEKKWFKRNIATELYRINKVKLFVKRNKASDIERLCRLS